MKKQTNLVMYSAATAILAIFAITLAGVMPEKTAGEEQLVGLAYGSNCGQAKALRDNFNSMSQAYLRQYRMYGNKLHYGYYTNFLEKAVQQDNILRKCMEVR